MEQNEQPLIVDETMFEPHELVGLLWLKNHYYDHPEQQEINADNNRLLFVRWLVEQGILNEGLVGEPGRE